MRVVGIVLLVMSFIAHASPPREEYVTRIIDGDTVELSGGERIRLAGLQTPERGEPEYYKAGLHLANLCLRRPVKVVRFPERTYNRTVGVLWVGNRQVNAVMRKRFKSRKYDRLLTDEQRDELVRGGWK